MTFPEEDYLKISGIQHFAFCRRQWALIHIEDQWEENYRTTDGELMHKNVHDSGSYESRGDLLIYRAVRIHSANLGISGECDVVEFRRAEDGVSLPDRSGLWQPYPVEYKRGKPGTTDGNRLQLCAQAMCLEEMLCCPISSGALYYGEIRHRETIEFTEELREQVRSLLAEMHDLYRRGHTPRVKPKKGCASCSLKEVCLPKMLKSKPVAQYITEAINGEKTP